MERLRECLASATFWNAALAGYADRNQRWADRWAIAAGLIAAVTAVAIWPIAEDGSSGWEKALLSAGAFVAAICTTVRSIKKFDQRSGAARELAPRYGRQIGGLMDLIASDAADQMMARSVVDEFEATKIQKDQLHALPSRSPDRARPIRRRRQR